jgi:hypothetical protein
VVQAGFKARGGAIPFVGDAGRASRRAQRNRFFERPGDRWFLWRNGAVLIDMIASVTTFNDWRLID